MKWLATGEREVFQQLVAAKDAEIQRLTHLLHAERQLSDATVRQMVSDVLLLKREGFVSRVVPQAVAPVAPGPTDPVEQVIAEYEEKAPKGAAVRKGLELYAARMRARGKSDDEIVVGIHKGGSWDDAEDDDA